MWAKLFRREPQSFTLRLQPSGAVLAAQAEESLLQAALREGLPFPHNCRVGGCGECKCRLVSGKVKELTDKSYLLSAEELQQGFILACQSRPRSDMVVEVALREAAAAHPAVETTGRITGLHRLTADIAHLVLALDAPMRYSGGQYAELSVPGLPGEQGEAVRSYSFASAHDPADPTRVDFFVRKVPGGLLSPRLVDEARLGEVLHVRGPHGQFGMGSGDGPMVCVAGGSGLAPIKAMLEQAVSQHQATRPLTLVLAARTEADLYGLDAIDAIRRRWSGRFRFVPVLSAEPDGSGWAGLRGMVADRLSEVLGERMGEHQAWLCGPPPMIDACEAVLCGAGVPAARVHADRFLDASHLAQPAASANPAARLPAGLAA